MTFISIPSASQLVAPIDLPNEMWVEVFSHLEMDELLTCESICKQWCRVAQDNALWSRFFQGWPEPFKTKKEIFSRFDGGISTIAQLVDKLIHLIEKTPLGQDGKTFQCVFPLNPEYGIIFSLTDTHIAQNPPYCEKQIDENPSARCHTCVFMRALPHQEAVIKEIGESVEQLRKNIPQIPHAWMSCRDKVSGNYTRISLHHAGVSVMDKNATLKISCPGLSVRTLSVISEKTFFHEYRISYRVPSDDKFNRQLESKIDRALASRTRAIAAHNRRMQVAKWAAFIASLALAVKCATNYL